MPYLRTIPPEKSEGELKTVYQKVKEQRGAIANVYQIHSLLPRTLEPHLNLYLGLMFDPSTLTRQERETIAVAVSRANECTYCVEHHADALSRYQKNRTVLDALKQGRESTDLTAREHALVRFAGKLTQDPSGVRKADVEALRQAGLADEEILLATLIVGYFNFVNRLVLGLGVEREAQVAGPYKY